ncbi:hypothetical protein LJC04_04945 [Ruminococcaceae bacterium OttesenSCG-928-O06]|nr:hypothetical protein [Ruminococcaceae bacterium OttesenSCG-928-O06]
MQFTSLPFAAFLCGAAAVFFLLPPAARRLFLAAASLFVYCYPSPWQGAFLLLSVALTYGGARLLDRTEGPRTRRLLLAAGAVLNLAFLLFFKYYNFAAQNLAALCGLLGLAAPLPALALVAPVGISFYTFQSLGYLVDVYRRQTQPERNIVTYTLFVAFFPQVQAGPISRSTSLLPQLRSPAPAFDGKRVERSLLLAGWGLFKKLVIADRLAIFVGNVFDGHAGGTGAVAVAAVVLFAFQMYCDFSGYTAMALGIAGLFGYRLDPNFQLPYFSGTIPEFWRRWHMTLGSWFRDYLFYPILRNRRLNRLAKAARKTLPKTLANNIPVVVGLVVVWFCTGFWHGTGWNYIVWGLYHGLLIILSTLAGPWLKKRGQALGLPLEGRAFALFRVVRTFALVCVGYVFFRSASLGAALGLFARLWGGAGPAALWDGTLLQYGLDGADFAVALAGLAVLFAVEFAQRKRDLLAWVPAQRRLVRWAVYLVGILVLLVFGMYGEGYVEKPFLYFQF